MTMESLNQLGYGGAHQNTRLPRILAELQGMQTSLVTGTNASAIVDAKGPDLQDTILSAIYFTTAAGAPTDKTANISIIDVRPTGNITLTTGVADGDVVSINGKAYTAKAVTPSTTNRGLTGLQFSTGKQEGGATVLTADQIMALNLSVPPANGIGTTVPLTRAQAVTLAAGAAINISALSLANAVNAIEGTLLTASCTLASGVCSLWADAESTAGNSVALDVTAAGGHATRSGATFSGGLFGLPNGTVTFSSTGAAAADTVTLGGVVYTAIAAATSVSGTNQWRAILAADVLTHGVNALMEQGLTYTQATAIASAATNAGAIQTQAALLAMAFNKNQGALVTATYTGASGVVSITQDAEGAALALVKSGANIAVSAATLTVASRGWLPNVDLSLGTILITWFRKSRLVGQW